MSTKIYTYTSKVGDRLDQVCVIRYGSSANDVVVFVLNQNPGLERQDIVLVPGTVVYLPDLPVSSTLSVVRKQVYLWS